MKLTTDEVRLRQQPTARQSPSHKTRPVSAFVPSLSLDSKSKLRLSNLINYHETYFIDSKRHCMLLYTFPSLNARDSDSRNRLADNNQKKNQG